MIATKTAANRKLTLRDVQKAHTRQRLLEAARSVFYREGYYAATVDQIVSEAGASRPTFYLHFRDKEQVLAELVALYAARAAPYMERVPGPRPTVEELKQWLEEVGQFLEQERALFTLVHEVSAHKQTDRPHYGLTTVDAWITSLSRRAPAFAAAVRGKKQDLEARVWAELLVVDIVWAAANVAKDKASAFTQKTVTVVAKSLHDFMNDPRYHVDSIKAKKVTGTRPRRGTGAAEDGRP